MQRAPCYCKRRRRRRRLAAARRPDGCRVDERGIPGKAALTQGANPGSIFGNTVDRCFRLTADTARGGRRGWARATLKAACDGTDVAACEAECSRFYMVVNVGARICSATTDGKNCNNPKADNTRSRRSPTTRSTTAACRRRRRRPHPRRPPLHAPMHYIKTEIGSAGPSPP